MSSDDEWRAYLRLVQHVKLDHGQISAVVTEKAVGALHNQCHVKHHYGPMGPHDADHIPVRRWSDTVPP